MFVQHLLDVLFATSVFAATVTTRSDRPAFAGDLSLLSRGSTSAPFESFLFAGAFLSTPPPGQLFTSVTGTFKVPDLTILPGTISLFGENGLAIVGIGIDATNPFVSVSAGVSFANSSGNVILVPFIEWGSAFGDEPNLTVVTGDLVTLTITLFSPTFGSFDISVNGGAQTAQDNVVVSSEFALAQQNAGWFMEILLDGLDIGNATFTGASASTGSETVGLSGATIFDLQDSNGDGEAIASASVLSDSSVVVFQT